MASPRLIVMRSRAGTTAMIIEAAVAAASAPARPRSPQPRQLRSKAACRGRDHGRRPERGGAPGGEQFGVARLVSAAINGCFEQPRLDVEDDVAEPMQRRDDGIRARTRGYQSLSTITLDTVSLKLISFDVSAMQSRTAPRKPASA